MSNRALWFETHLLGDRAGRRARDAAVALGEVVHERFLAIGDELAVESAVVAQQFYRHAAVIWETLGEADFERWVRIGVDHLRGDAVPRDMALAHFTVVPKAVGRCGLDALQRWGELAQHLARTSRRLASTFLTTTAPLLGKIPVPHFDAWVQEGLRLFGTSGWRGEFLAQAYLNAASHALPLLGAADLTLWADLGVALLPVIKETQFFAPLPDGLGLLAGAERNRFLAAVLQMARVSPKAALTVYRELPPAIRRVHLSHRGKLVEIFHSGASAAAEDLAELSPVAGALVHDLPRAQRAAALDLAVHIAQRFPAASAAALRSLPAAHEIAGADPLPAWAQRGLEVAADNPEAGVAYFALQSRTSLKVLEAASTAVTLNEVQGLLRKLIQMLSGQPATLRSADGSSLRPPLEEWPLEGEVAVPLRLDVFPTHEDNVAVYRFVAAQLAGRRSHGTYDVRLPDGCSSLVAHLEDEKHPPLLEPLFRLAEGFRIAAALGREYAGLRAEQRQLARRILARLPGDRLPSQSELLDALLMWLLGGDTIQGPPSATPPATPPVMPVWLRAMAGLVAPCVAPLAASGATADDSLTIAHLLAAELARSADADLQAALTAQPNDALGGEALIDHYLYDYDAEGDAPAVVGDGDTATSSDEPLGLPEDTKLQLQDEQEDSQGPTTPLSAEALQQLLEAGADLRLKQGYNDDVEGLGLYISDLLGKVPAEQLQDLKRLLYEGEKTQRTVPRRWIENRGSGASFYYDEWDYHIEDYRQRWCRLREVATESDSGEFFHQTLLEYSALIPEVRRQFQKIRPEMYRVVRGLEDGEDFDLNAVVNARVDRRARLAPSSKLYTARVREERDVATLFLIDMSASTDEPLEKAPPTARLADDDTGRDDILGQFPTAPGHNRQRRIIDVTKEALVIMAEALEEIGDNYAIYGFSGHGRQNVEFYLVKSFNESLSPAVQGRIGALEPKRSTRMGTALRHATEKLSGVTSRARHIILLSDGFPQDFDYGQDRRSNVYGLRDTTVALRECEAAGITPFCITVDKAGHDYLREMCDGSRYMVIDDIASLPRELPKIYQRVVGP